MMSDKFSTIQENQIRSQNNLINMGENGDLDDKEIEEQTFEDQTNPDKKKG
jgi:hypothetical protein